MRRGERMQSTANNDTTPLSFLLQLLLASVTTTLGFPSGLSETSLLVPGLAAMDGRLASSAKTAITTTFQLLLSRSQYRLSISCSIPAASFCQTHSYVAATTFCSNQQTDRRFSFRSCLTQAVVAAERRRCGVKVAALGLPLLDHII